MEMNLSPHSDDIGLSLNRAWASSRALAASAPILVDEVEHVRKFNERLAERETEPGIAEMQHEFIRHGIGSRSRDEWIGMFRDHGFRGVFGKCTVLDTTPDEPVMLWRLADADDYSLGLSWAGDPRFAHSRAWMDYRIDSMNLWCAVVPPEALLGVSWYGPGVKSGGRPLWRTIDSEALGGRVRVTLDCFGEWFVDPTMLDRVGVFDEFTREPFEREPEVPSCGSYRSWPTGRIVGAASCKPDGCGDPDGCRAITPVPSLPRKDGQPRTGSWFRGVGS